MSSRIVLDNITAISAPASFSDDLAFEVTFSVFEPIVDPLLWRIIYVGSAYSQDYDQTLQEFEVGPIENRGIMKFEIACKGPDASKIPRKELLCVTALLLTASYRNQQFIRVGYYVHNQLIDQGEQQNIEELELSELVKKIKRTIISDKPRVTKFNIEWQDKKNYSNQDSQSKLQDYFSASGRSKIQEQDSTSQKSHQNNQSQNQSIQQQKKVMSSF